MEISKGLVMRTIDTNEDEIITNRNGAIDVISTGLRDIILEVSGIETLKSMNVRRESMIKICREYNLIGMHVVSRETIEQDSDFSCRNFAPIVGIDEESATGTSNASLLYYCIRNDNNFDYDRTYKIEQGYFMNSPSNIYAKADKESGSIYVGGIARIDKEVEILI